jgi:hypothetical protein
MRYAKPIRRPLRWPSRGGQRGRKALLKSHRAEITGLTAAGDVHTLRADAAEQEASRERAAREELAAQLRATRTALQEESTKRAEQDRQVTELRVEVEQLHAAERGRAKGK